MRSRRRKRTEGRARQCGGRVSSPASRRYVTGRSPPHRRSDLTQPNVPQHRCRSTVVLFFDFAAVHAPARRMPARYHTASSFRSLSYRAPRRAVSAARMKPGRTPERYPSGFRRARLPGACARASGESDCLHQVPLGLCIHSDFSDRATLPCLFLPSTAPQRHAKRCRLLIRSSFSPLQLTRDHRCLRLLARERL
jgi:hypothetical protein